MVLIAVLCLPTAIADGLERSGGSYYAYDIEMVVEAVSVHGILIYDHLGAEQAQTGHEVDVFRVTGHFEGSSIATVVNTSVTGAVDGWSYVLRGSIAKVMEETTTFVNTTNGVGTMLIATSYETYEMVQYSPPLMSDLDESTVTADDRWNETVEVTRISSTSNGSEPSEQTVVDEEHYSFSIISTNEEIETAAGDFRCIVINISSEHGSEIVWHCPDTGSFVRIERYDSQSSDPLYVASLSDYSIEKRSNAYLILIVGTVAGASVLVVVVIVVMMDRRSRTPIGKRVADSGGEDDDETGDIG
ncbi:MAG: hypothetical protein JSU93_07410 [Methanobacteriota archaeon]|nr:MAG: hypothetical protein JSU93_07410 [Euryarchaeota archaeon]